MKKLKIWASTLLLVMLIVMSAGCYVVKGQRMSRVKGTYELTRYTRTDGKTSEVTDYIEEYGYRVYLVVTGSSEGYYVYQDEESTTPRYQTVTLSYEYDQDNSKLVEYVIYRIYNEDEQRFGVTKNALNFSRPSIKWGENLAQDGIDMDWKRVSAKTDLSYVESQLGTLEKYDPTVVS